MHFTTREKVAKTFWFCDLFMAKTVHLQQFKRMQSSKLGQLSSLVTYVKRVPFVGNRR